jgi:hypothetical protein
MRIHEGVERGRQLERKSERGRDVRVGADRNVDVDAVWQHHHERPGTASNEVACSRQETTLLCFDGRRYQLDRFGRHDRDGVLRRHEDIEPQPRSHAPEQRHSLKVVNAVSDRLRSELSDESEARARDERMIPPPPAEL